MVSNTESYSSAYDDHSSDEYPPDWQARRKRVLKRDNSTCQRCGVRSTRVDDVRLDVDHIIPKSDGGSHALHNLQALCPSCHAEKHSVNRKLEQRARTYESRNRGPLWLRALRIILVIPIALGLLSESEDQTVSDEHGRELSPLSLHEAKNRPEDTGVTVEVTVESLWESDSDSVHQLGEVSDLHTGEPKVRFVIWDGHGHQSLQEGGQYRFIGAKTNSYQGDFQLVVDRWTSIRLIDVMRERKHSLKHIFSLFCPHVG
jgi:hypothetical protein